MMPPGCTGTPHDTQVHETFARRKDKLKERHTFPTQHVVQVSLQPRSVAMGVSKEGFLWQ